MTNPRWRGRISRRGPVSMLAAALVSGALAGTVAALAVQHSAAPLGAHSAATIVTGPIATARVVRTDLTNTIAIDGTVRYSPAVTVVNQLSGAAVTALPAVGSTVGKGESLYEVDGDPVWLFYGSRPEWRTLQLGVTAGPDVAQLDDNLIGLGYATAAGLPPSNTFSYATALAVTRWQTALGQAATGTVAFGQVVYLPGPLRVTTYGAPLGSPATPGEAVLSGTGTSLVVQADIPVAQSYLVHPGDDVTAALPDGSTIPGRVAQMSVVAAQTSTGDQNGSNPPSGVGGTNAAMEAVTVTLQDLPRPDLDQAPATIQIVSARASDVLAVPVNALLALAGGGYAVNVIDGRARHRVAVQTGLFAGSLVQVNGNGLSPGVSIQVAAP